MKKTIKFGMLLSFLIILVLLITGCEQYEISVELNKDKTGSITFLKALIESSESQKKESELTVNFPFDASIEGIEYKSEKVSYEDNGNTYIGKKEICSFKDIEIFLGTTEGFKIINLPSGNKELKALIPEHVYEKDIKRLKKDGLGGLIELLIKDGILSEDSKKADLSLYDILATIGMKCILNVKTDYEVVSHNADKAENGVYTWDLLKRMVQEELYEQATVLFIEYKPVENESYGAGLNKRAEINKLLGIVQGDKDSYGRALNKLGILKGTDAGLELDKGLTRAEGAVMYARLLNLESEVKKFAKESPGYDSGFTDIPEWVKPTINYLHFKNMIAGIGNNRYGSNDFMTEAQYSTLVLRALGYDDSEGDFTWYKACEKIKEIGLFNDDALEPEAILGEKFTRRGMSYISYNALFFKNYKTGEVLIDRLRLE